MKVNAESLSRRQFLKGATLASMGLVAAACAAPAAPAAPASSGDTGEAAPGAEPIFIDFWDMVWGPAEYIDTGNALVDQFNQEQGEIEATYQSTPWTNWYQTFLTAIGSGTAPDCSTGAGYQAVQFYDQGAVVPVDQIVEDWRNDGDADDFFEGTIDRLIYEGHYMAIPWNIDIRIPWVRTDHLDKTGLPIPSNWTELDAAIEAMTDGDVYGIIAPNDTGGSHYIYWLFINNEGGIFNEDLALDLMYDRNVEAMNYASNWVSQGWMHPGSAGFVGDDAERVFGQGYAGVIINNPYFSAEFSDDAAANMAPTNLLESPHGSVGTVSWVNNMMMYEQAEDKDATMTFMKWWSANQLPLWTAGHGTTLPVRNSFTSDSYFQDNKHVVKVLEEWVPVGDGTAARGEGIFPALNEVEGEGVMQTMWQDILQGKSVEETMATANARLETIVS